MKNFLLIAFFVLSCVHVSAQKYDSLPATSGPSASSIFSNADTITTNDYLLSIEKVFQVLNKAPVLSQPVPSILEINRHLNDDDSALAIIQNRLNGNVRTLNIRNLQMFSIILKQVNNNSNAYANELHDYDSIYNEIKYEVAGLRKDTLIRKIVRDPALRDSFRTQLLQLRSKWKKADSLMKYTHLLISKTQARTSNNLITSNEMQLQAQGLMASTGPRIFGKESDYLWVFKKAYITPSFSEEFQKSLVSERKITRYYFANTNNQLLLLLLCGIVFFCWVFYNFKSLEKLGQTETLQPFNFRYMNRAPVFASLIVMLNFAPLFDLDAPFIYIATIEFLLMVTLTYSFWKRLKRRLFYVWLAFILLFFVQSFSRYLNLPEFFNRWLILILNALCVLLGLYLLSVFKKQYREHRFLMLTAALYTLFNFLAVVCNFSGRTTLTLILGSTGTYAVIQTVGLLVFIESITEAFLLQVQAGRMRKEYTSGFDRKEISKGIMKFVIFFSVIIWLVVFATNLNIYHFIWSHLSAVLNKVRSLGSFVFTYGGIILFVLILYIAHLLQKYIGYFFGDIGDEGIFDNKGQRSKLMIFKLVLLVGGFLLAVAASGLAVDKITVILGALSVGIGLGLQGIVNNFVSGIILIFDHTINIGDTVEIGDKKGRVRQISMRSSSLLTADGAEVIIPNGAILSNNFVNWSLNENYIRVELTFTVDKISKDIREEITNILKSLEDVVKKKEPEILINTVTSQSTQLKIYFWCDDITVRDKSRSEAYSAVSKYLEEKEIKIM
ncbi:MAG: mechanosensitive ion channel domain-containing protein [Ginsengibacter sp.]